MGRKKAGLEKYLPYALSIWIFFTAGMVSAEPKNLVTNGGFERADVHGRAIAWRDNSRWADVNVKYIREHDEGRDGFVQRIVCDRFNRGAVQFIQPGVKLVAGKTYAIRFWAKGELGSPLEILLRKQGKPYTTYFSRAFKITDEWKEYRFTANVPISDSSAYFMFRFTSKGELFIDDVSVTEAEAVINSRMQNPGNLIPNASFEVGIDRWGVEIRGSGAEYEMPIRALELKPDVDKLRRKSGRYALKIPGVVHSRFVITSSNIVLTPGVKHSLSLWIYSETERDLRIGLKTGYFGRTRDYLKAIKVGPEWGRYQISVDVTPSEGNAYFIVVEGAGPGALWIDSVQLEEGAVTPFKEDKLVETGFLRGGAHPIYYKSEDISIPVRIYAHEKIDDCEISVTSVDYYGNQTALLEEDCNLSVVTHRDIHIRHPSEKHGYFRLIAKATIKGQLADSSEFAIGVIPEISGAPEKNRSPFGGHGRFSPGELETLAKLGVGWLRMHPPNGTKWSIVEKQKGKFQFFESEVKSVKNAGINILGSLDKTPRWASNAPEGERRYWAYAPENLDDWENYVYQTVKHYKGVIDYWEVWNEPDSGGFLRVLGLSGEKRKPGIYVELLKRAYRAAKRANPDAVIVGGVATGHPPSRWLGKIIELGALEYMDIISFHFYTDGRPGDALDVTTGVDIQEIKQLMRLSAGRTIPIWETESGIMFPRTEYFNLKELSPSYAVPGDEAVAYLIRNYIHLISSGVDKWFYYSMFTSPRIDRREATGFFEWDGSPRPLAVAYAVLVSMLEGMEFSNEFTLDRDVSGAKFRGKGRIVKVLWSKKWSDTSGSYVSLDVANLHSTVTVYDAMGNTIEVPVEAGRLKLKVTREPIYVTID